MALYLPDVNVLIHALRGDSEAHQPCHKWLSGMVKRGDILGLCELVEVALLRIPTLPKLDLVPIGEMLGFWLEDLWGYHGTRRLAAGPNHMEIFWQYTRDLAITGNDFNDVWLAALAVEHGATLVSTDRGFARFKNLRWLNPLD